MKRLVPLSIGIVGVVIAAWFFYTSWKFDGVTWLWSPPDAVKTKGHRFQMIEGPIQSLGGDDCVRIDSIPISGKPICLFKGDVARENSQRYVAIEWGPDEYYKYTDSGPTDFWRPTTW
ncbi:hypothetical protein [Nocardia transvalensis]|uniref:hypothetical protein n=1 Tax=Nocardia transvalensis TaxID=37333 RepID=UPI0018943856|nr:hypothetical protein [Nocardia transvalensis]MBF6333580.1 hypothetical protein [Nocardia transvalensis]